MAGHMCLQVWPSKAYKVLGDVYPEDEAEIVSEEENTEMTYCGEYWFAEYSAPGYMDKTDFTWSMDGPIDAARECFAIYGDDEKGSDDRRELAQVIRQARAQGFRR